MEACDAIKLSDNCYPRLLEFPIRQGESNMKKILAAIMALMTTISCNAQNLIFVDYLGIYSFSLINEVASSHCNKLYPDQSTATEQARQQYLISKKIQIEVAIKLINLAKKRGADTSKYNTNEIAKKLTFLLDDSKKSKAKEFCDHLIQLTLSEASLSPAQYSIREFEKNKTEMEFRFGQCDDKLQNNAARAASRFLVIAETPNGNAPFPRYEADPMLVIDVNQIQKSVSACLLINQEAIQRRIPFEPNFASTKALADALLEAAEFDKDKTVRAIEAARFFLKSR